MTNEDKLNKLIRRDFKKCRKCGKKIIPDKEAINFTTKKWDGHSYKFSCKCYNKNTRISIG